MRMRGAVAFKSRTRSGSGGQCLAGAPQCQPPALGLSHLDGGDTEGRTPGLSEDREAGVGSSGGWSNLPACRALPARSEPSQAA